MSLYFPSSPASVQHAFKTNPIQTDQRLREHIQTALLADTTQISQTKSRLLDKPGQLFEPSPQKTKFHHRDPALNDLSLFYAALDTEIANNATLKALPPDQKAAASTRLIAKRFIDADTNLSLYGLGEKGNPAFHEQRKPFRTIRGEAATATIGAYRGEYIQKLYQHIMDSIDFSKQPVPVTVFLVRPGRSLNTKDATINYLSLAAQGEVLNSLTALAKREGQSGRVRFSEELQLPVLSRTARSNASPLGRLIQQGFYDTSGIKKGDQVVIVDDHSQAGATILSMAAALQSKGANVLGAIVPTVHPLSRQLKMEPETKALLSQTLTEWDPKQRLPKELNKLGMPLDTLTNTEALILIAYATDPQDQAAMRRFHALEKKLHAGKTVPEGESDSLNPILAAPAVSVEKLIENMRIEEKQSRRVTRPINPQSVHVLDWDDFLRDEKGMNYRLMHNAIEVSAQRYGTQYPFLNELNRALTAKRDQYQPNQGMPLLSMSPEQFAHSTIQNTKFLKRDAIKDLLSHLDGLSPGLQKTFDNLPAPGKKTTAEQTQIIDNILWHEFRRQYQASILPETPNVSKTKKPNLDLPFQDVRPQLMSGAHPLLERLRRPENVVCLISNRPHGDLEKEVNQMSLAHYFDFVQGTPERLVTPPGEEPTLRHPQYKKPDPFRLKSLQDKHRVLTQAPKWHFWGDTSKDITQAFQAFDTPPASLRGTLINPSIQEQTRIKEEAQRSDLLFKIRTADSLESLVKSPPKSE